MFCDQCGKQLPDESVFCENCGARVSVEDTGIAAAQNNGIMATSPTAFIDNGRRKIFDLKKKGVKVIALTVIVLAAIAVISSILMSSGRGYVYSTLRKTQKAYKQEIGHLVDKNPVLKSMKTNLSQSNTQQIKVAGGRLTISDDKKSKALSAEIKGDYLPFTCRLFLTDTRLIVGAQDLLYLEADPKNLGSELVNFAGNMGSLGSIENLDELAGALNTYDLSYSNVTSMNISRLLPDYAVFMKRYMDVTKKLLDKADYRKDRSNVQIDGKTVKTDRVTLTADAKTIKSWLKSDLLPTIQKDKELAKQWDAYQSVYENMNTWYSRQDYADFIDELADNIDYMTEQMEEEDIILSARADIYKGVIVSLALSIRSDDLDEEVGITLSALGKKYRLDDIRVEINDGDQNEPAYITLEGEHIGVNPVTSTITVKDNLSKQRVSVEWDTKEVSNNLKIKADGNTIRATLALDGKGVVAKYDDVSWNLRELEESVKLPEKTTKIKNTTVEEITGGLSPFIQNFF